MHGQVAERGGDPGGAAAHAHVVEHDEAGRKEDDRPEAGAQNEPRRLVAHSEVPAAQRSSILQCDLCLAGNLCAVPTDQQYISFVHKCRDCHNTLFVRQTWHCLYFPSSTWLHDSSDPQQHVEHALQLGWCWLVLTSVSRVLHLAGGPYLEMAHLMKDLLRMINRQFQWLT